MEEDSQAAEREFRARCTVPFRLDRKGKIWCDRKLDARPPDCLIPARVLALKELHDRQGFDNPALFRSVSQRYSALQWLRRFRLIPPSRYGTGPVRRRRVR